ncbi:Gfo/Idh/MocA family oxidoreductase [Streptomyces niveiscabiei]|uniref:Gfo/Idh/MocA family oxidoreductase n=1 Tax=Streptomyces niveiscabiei TaxID=164115 RepID=UPI0029BE9F5D|nr:Gfo/Idh/MocA family oxidoreductase [Streptomyces niveiscabiei]MDX3387668.1 Gfo/Idh/MocA family oxidoreductase [Streptomyces niveiscabiei]
MTREKPVTRVVVCGTGFGRVYLSAFREPGPEFPFRLTGVLGRGSARSKACAERYGVPLLTDPDDVPALADLACVVVPNGVGGGEGAALAQRLMDQGVHVLHEHPIHRVELAACLRSARANGVQYRLNTFYPHLAPVRRFLAAARHLAGRQELLYAEGACAIHVAYDLVDILGQALGGLRPWQFTGPAPGGGPFSTLEGRLNGVPVTLRVLNQLDPEDPDNHTHLLHRAALGFSGGTLTLASTHGPVLWSPALPAPRGDDGELDFDSEAHRLVRLPSVQPVGPAEAPTHREVYTEVWPEGVRRALRAMAGAAGAGEDPLRAGQYHLTLSEIWEDLTARLGYPELVRRPAPEPVTAPDLVAAVREREGL